MQGYFLGGDDNIKDAEFIAKGIWKKHKKYGYYFEFSEFEIQESNLFYFLSRVVKGVGRNLASSMIETYGEENLVDILENTPEKLLEVKGIKSKKLKKITTNWDKYKSLKDISDVLTPLGATQNIINKVYYSFKEELEENKNFKDELSSNIYLITKIKGIGFKTADKLARASGIDIQDDNRIKACVNYIILSYTTDDGNSCITKELLFELINSELSIEDGDGSKISISKEKFESNILSLIEEKELVEIGEDKLSSSFLNFAENSIMEIIKSKATTSNRLLDDIDNYIRMKEAQMGFEFSEQQKEAIKVVNDGYKAFILAGYAGSGKSTISRAILELFENSYSKDKIVCCALSGMASDRIRKTSGFNSFTIQSMLVKLQKLEDKILNYDVVLLDESSMVNSELMYKLLKAIKHEATIILVGDPAQLPPIGAGNPFSDLITLNIAPTIQLTKIYRQSDDKVITYFANQIREAKIPDNFKEKFDDFFFLNTPIKNYFSLKSKHKKKELSDKEWKEIRDRNSLSISKKIEISAQRIKPKLLNFFKQKNTLDYLFYFQVITPMKSGMLGVDELNLLLQKTLNSQEVTVDLGKVQLNLFDKVVHTKNIDMEAIAPEDFKSSDGEKLFIKRRVFNGMVGVLVKVDFSEELLYIYYPNDHIVVEYGFDDARELIRLAYALTIHKTQGSEYKNVIIPITYSHFMMLNNKLLYTAITRAKDKVVLIGEDYAFKSSCKRLDVTKRDTVMLNSSQSVEI